MDFHGNQESGITRCSISTVCLDSYPACQHHCVITYQDGSQKQKLLSGWDLISNEYWKVLDNKSHFNYMQAFVLKRTKTERYCDFLAYIALNQEGEKPNFQTTAKPLIADFKNP